YWRDGSARRRVFDQRRYRLAVIQSKGGDVNKPSYLWIVAGFCDYRSAVRMTNENHLTAVRCQNTFGHGNIIRERYRWVLDDADGVAVSLEDFMDIFPTRAIHEASVNKNDCLYSRIGC